MKDHPVPQARNFTLACIRCGAEYPADFTIDSRGCPACAPEAPANLALRYSGAPAIDMQRARAARGLGMARFAPFLPVAAADMVRMGEGDTPLVAAPAIGGRIGVERLFFKDESRNPTWSHKDRFSAVAVSYARRQGVSAVATASSGNAGASLAAYAAKAGLPCIVFTFQNSAGPMVEQIARYGAMVVPVPRPQDRWPLLAAGVARFRWMGTSPFAAPVVGSHPVGIEGYKTLAYELYEDLEGTVPDWIVVPTSYGDILAGIWRGFQDLAQMGLIRKLPRLVVAEVYRSVEQTLATGSDQLFDAPRTFESLAVSIAASQGTFQSLQAVRQSNGRAVTLVDDELLRVQRDMARTEGVLGELSSVAAVAATARLRHEGIIAAGETVVCVMTSTGLKDLDKSGQPAPPVEPVRGGLDAALAYLRDAYGFSPG